MHSFTSSSERIVPATPWRPATLLALALFLGGIAAWELYWRSQDMMPSTVNSDGLWAIQRRAVDDHPRPVVIAGSSRTLFDIDLDVWAEELDTAPPIQLSLEGTPPIHTLRDLAGDRRFDGFLVVGYTPGLFLAPFEGVRADTVQYYRRETPSEWLAQRLSMPLEQCLAFLDSDTRLDKILGRLPWPVRPGTEPPRMDVRKLLVMREDRQAKLWSRVVTDPDYRQLARDIWRQLFDPPEPLPPPVAGERIDETARLVDRIRQRGGQVLFVRLPSAGAFREAENTICPRPRCWDALLEATGAPGIHFEDHPSLEGFELPEWSHIRADQTERFTRNLVDLVRPHYTSWRDH